MTDSLDDYFSMRPATAGRPLLGLTILVVEDSRFASEALRLMAQRSGARMRRADCLRAAQRHLQTYRPNAVIVDLGLPDGSGADLIRAIRAARAPAPAMIGLSGDPDRAEEAFDAGADGFLAKPLDSLALFQRVLLEALPESIRPTGPRPIPDEPIAPDPIALRDDLFEAARILAERPDAAAVGYLSQFLSGVARSARDDVLEDAARALRTVPSISALTRASGLVQARLASGSAF